MIMYFVSVFLNYPKRYLKREVNWRRTFVRNLRTEHTPRHRYTGGTIKKSIINKQVSTNRFPNHTEWSGQCFTQMTKWLTEWLTDCLNSQIGWLYVYVYVYVYVWLYVYVYDVYLYRLKNGLYLLTSKEHTIQYITIHY